MPVSLFANPYPDVWKDFCTFTANHELTVIRDDGLYRHLRVQAPGTRIWSWDIVTWPGHLATSGDIADGYMFTRLPDMLEFFDRAPRMRYICSDGAPIIDVRYWAEKLCGGRSDDVKKYSSETFLRHVREGLEESKTLGLQADVFRTEQIALLEHLRNLKQRSVGENTLPTVAEQLEKYWAGTLSLSALFSQDGLSSDDVDLFYDVVDPNASGASRAFDISDLEAYVARRSPAESRDAILYDARQHTETKHEAYTWLRNNEDSVGADTWEWNLTEYTLDFLLACYAIDMTVRLYREYEREQDAAANPQVEATSHSSSEETP